MDHIRLSGAGKAGLGQDGVRLPGSLAVLRTWDMGAGEDSLREGLRPREHLLVRCPMVTALPQAHSYFTGEGTKVQRGLGTCSLSRSRLLAEPGLELSSACLQSPTLSSAQGQAAVRLWWPELARRMGEQSRRHRL